MRLKTTSAAAAKTETELHKNMTKSMRHVLGHNRSWPSDQQTSADDAEMKRTHTHIYKHKQKSNKTTQNGQKIEHKKKS